MNDDLFPRDPQPSDDGPIDDELLNAVLDGEATPDERARVEGSVEGRRRLARLRVAAEAVAAPVEALDPDTVDRLVARALEAAPSRATGPTGSSPVSPPPADELLERRARRDRWRTVGRIAAAVAAIVVVVGGVAALARTVGRSSSDTASSSADSSAGSAASPELESSGSDPATAPTRSPLDLGLLVDAAAVLARYDQLRATTTTDAVEHQFPDEGLAGSTGRAADDGPGTVCSVPPLATAPGEAWSVTAVAVLPTGPVLVMSNGTAPPGERILVVDTQTCTVLVDRTR